MPYGNTLASFPPEFALAWQLALERKLALPFPTKSAALSMRQKLNHFRKVASKELGPVAQDMYNVDLVIKADPTGAFVIEGGVTPWKQVIREQAQAASLEAPQAGSPPPVEPPATPSTSAEAALSGANSEHLNATLANLGLGSK